MSILLAMPDWEITPRDFRRFLTSLSDNLGDDEVIVGSSPEWSERHREILGHPVVAIRRLVKAAYDAVVFVAGPAGPSSRKLLGGVELPADYPTFRFNLASTYFRARLELTSQATAPRYYGHRQAHAFNRLAPPGTDFFQYFPYGYTFRCLGMGPVNEFGLRIDRPLRDFINRPADHKLIVIYGGSAAWSLDCLHSEMFAARLEALLNERAAAAGGRLRFTVLNGGQHGHVLLNEMLTHLLFFQTLKPDAVIAHDGYNDLVYGMLSDPGLLAEHDIAYQYNLETWSQILHATAAVPTTWDNEKPYSIKNFPKPVLDAYIRRKRQFADIVTAAGGRFIWGLQPFLESKAGLHRLEQVYLEADKPLRQLTGEAVGNVLRLYDAVSERLDKLDGDHVNLHRQFHRFGEDALCFADHVHPTPEGDARIAEIYADHLWPGFKAAVLADEKVIVP